MSKIEVTVRSDIGDPGVHHKHGALKPGSKVTIDEEDFGAELFERPDPDWLSPHELADKERALKEKIRVGNFEPPAEEAVEPAEQVEESAEKTAAPAKSEKSGRK